MTQTRTALPVSTLNHLTAFSYEADYIDETPLCWRSLIGDAMVAGCDPESLSPLGILTPGEDTGYVLSYAATLRLPDDTFVRQGTGMCFTCMTVRNGRLYFLDGKCAGAYPHTIESKYVVLGHLERA